MQSNFTSEGQSSDLAHIAELKAAVTAMTGFPQHLAKDSWGLPPAVPPPPQACGAPVEGNDGYTPMTPAGGEPIRIANLAPALPSEPAPCPSCYASITGEVPDQAVTRVDVDCPVCKNTGVVALPALGTHAVRVGDEVYTFTPPKELGRFAERRFGAVEKPGVVVGNVAISHRPGNGVQG